MPRRLIINADGTWNTADKTPTNVAKFTRAIKPVTFEGISQISYYHEGVGTHGGLDRLLGGAFGHGISKNICDCYRFLVANYAPGDEIFLFGFSRGAYTVRSLVGLIRNCGLLLPRHAERIREAYDLYRDRDNMSHPNQERAQQFRSDYAREVRIKCLGVWDTVGSLGVPVNVLNRLFVQKFQFHDVQLSSWVDNAFQALAIDERRKSFAPAVWEPQNLPGQVVEQMWFAGAHANVGGGYPDSQLSDLAFIWMKERAESCGLEFDPFYVKEALSPAYDGKLANSMRWWYRPFGKALREITRECYDKRWKRIDTKESIHPSAIERYEKLSDAPHGPYSPPNLLGYIQEHQLSAPDMVRERRSYVADRTASLT